MAIGAIAAGASPSRVATLCQTGEHLGMAFQLKDDYSTEDLGKPLGVDLREGKLTLPLMHALQQVPAQKQQAILHMLKQAPHQPQWRAELMAFVR